MEALKSWWGKSIFGSNKEKKVKKGEIVKEEVGSRKRQLEEEVVTKDSLNHPAKRARMAETPDIEPTPTVKRATNPLHTFLSTFSWNSLVNKFKSSPEMVECSQASPPSIPVTIQAAPPTLYSSTRLDTDEVELLKVVNPKVDHSQATPKFEAHSIPIDKLATFSGFTKVAAPSTPNTPSHTGHSIRTAHEKARKAELLSPPNIRKRLGSGLRSTFDKFYHEKDIARRVWPGGIVKKKPKQNAFEFSASLADRDRYKALLERHSGGPTIVKYSALTNRTNILFDRPRNSPNRKGPLLGTLDVAAGVDNVDGSKIVTSTIIKPRLLTSTAIKTSTDQSNTSKVAVEASPVLGREKVVSPKTIIDATEVSTPPPTRSAVPVMSSLSSPLTPLVNKSRTSAVNKSAFTPVNSLEQKLACEEVYSPKYLAKLMDKFGAAAREREKQIQRVEERKIKCEKETEDLFDSIDQRLKSHLKITQVALPEAEVEEGADDVDQPTELPELTSEMQEVIRRAERSRGEVLVDAHKIQITVKDIGTLRGLNWLNDEVINFYMQMIVCRSGKDNFCPVYACTTFFYPKLKDGGHASVKRWTKKVDIFSHAIILIPVHLGMHWCLATIDMQRKAITYYDSMGGNNKGCLNALAEYVKEEHQAKKGAPLDMSKWSQDIAREIPQQMNGSDCGMFTCKFAEYLSRRAKFTFSQQDMPYFRKRMVYEIVKNKLLHP